MCNIRYCSIFSIGNASNNREKIHSVGPWAVQRYATMGEYSFRGLCKLTNVQADVLARV